MIFKVGGRVRAVEGAIGMFFSFIYFVVMTYKKQATIGKKLANLTVVSDKLENLTLRQVFLREIIGKIISSIIFFIGYIMVGFTQKKQGLHDKIAKTFVVFKDTNKKVNIWVIILGLVSPLLIIFIITYYSIIILFITMFMAIFRKESLY